MNNNNNLTEWLNGAGLENYKQAYKEGRFYSMRAFPINPIFGEDYLPTEKHKQCAPKNLMTLEQCQDYAATLNPQIDIVEVYNHVLGCVSNDLIKIGG